MCRREAEAADANMDVSKGREVLPKNVKPLHYDLTLEPNFDTFKFGAHVTIDLDVVEDTTSISLNAVDIEIQETKVTSGSHHIKTSKDVAYDEDKQTAKIDLEEKIPAGSKAQLYIKYTGDLNDKMAGFYRSSYKDAHGKEKWMATTQMEATDARRALPCFDEPALKAKFTVTLIADKHLTCLSNMDVAHEKEVDSQFISGKRKAVSFNKTPLMSTYLLAFIVAELEMYETKTFRVPVRVYCTPDKDPAQGMFSAELGAKTLEFYEKEFNSPFPLPKMDMVAIPDFAAGAMENWGLVTYRVVDLLLDEKTASASTRQRIAEVVQHELAHQWFGNLVTMDFWDGLWLNEGFATWMSWYSCNVFYPEWKVWEGYVTDNLQSALGLDGLRSSHPVEVPVKRADEINQIFDAISYSKGSCVIRMISKILGEDVFMEGIRRYLKKHAYGNTRTEDLWESLSDASGQDVVRIADIWTKNVGYPVVSVTEDYKNSSIHVKQNRFLRTADVKPEEDKTLYPIFLGLKTKEGLNKDLVLNEREANFKVDLDMYKLNTDHSGIYRTSYPPERLQKLGENAKAGLLSVEDRAGLIADAGALSGAGYQKTSGLLSLLKEFDQESEFVVWDELTARIGTVRAAWIFEDDKTKDALKAFQRDLSSKKSHELGWTFKESDGHIEQQFKSLMFGNAASAGDETTKATAFEMFEKFTAGDRAALHPNLRASVYSIVLQYGGEKEYDAIVKEYETGKNSDERNTALRSLGRAKDPKLMKRTIDYAFHGTEVKDQDIYLPLAALRTHREGIESFWEFFSNNYDLVKKKMPPAFTMLGTVVTMATSGFTKEKQLAEVEKFFEGKSTKGYERNLAQSFDTIRAKILWTQRDSEDVKQWLRENKYL